MHRKVLLIQPFIFFVLNKKNKKIDIRNEQDIKII